MTQTYHTIIIGAGPAGLAAARHLQGKTLILEKNPSIGLPVQCGEGISTQALEREGIEIDPKWVAGRIRHIRRIMPNGSYIGDRREYPYALVLNRRLFQIFLAGLSPWEIRSGVKAVRIEIENAGFVVHTDGGQRFCARYLIGADGPNSLAARHIFEYRPDLVPALNYSAVFEKPIADDALNMYFGRMIAPMGYGWVFPTSTHSANIGLLIKHKGRIRDFFNAFLNTVVKPNFGEFTLTENKSGILPVSGFYPRVARGNALLVGDAGAFTDPIFEGGLNMALLTGRLAAQSINEDDPAQYQAGIDQLPFSGKDLTNAQSLFYGLDDDTLNDLGEVLHGTGTSYLATREGQAAFLSRPNLVRNQNAIMTFAKIWQSAKPYIW